MNVARILELGRLSCLAHEPQERDACKSASQRECELKTIQLFLKEHETKLTPSDLAELIFLKQRIKRLDPAASHLIETIDRAQARLEVKDMPETDQLMVRMARLAVSSDPISSDSISSDSISSDLKREALIESLLLARSSVARTLYQKRPPHIGLDKLVQTVRICEQMGKCEALHRFFQQLESHGIDVAKLVLAQSTKPAFSDDMEELFRSMVGNPEQPLDWVLRMLKYSLQCDLAVGNRTPIPIYTEPNSPAEITITRLAVAILMQDEAFVESCLKKGVNPREADNQGYTPAHFAAILSNLQLLFTLYERGASFDAKTVQGATVYNLLRARGFAKDRASDSRYTTNALIMHWKDKLTEKSMDPIDPVIEKVKEAFIRSKEGNTPYDAPIYRRKLPPGHPLAGQWEACASRVIEPGEFILEYSGVVEKTLEIKDGTYALDLTKSTAVDAKEGGTKAELINHGPPNCSSCTVFYQGVPHRLFFATCRIEKDEPLYYNYGLDYFRRAKRKFTELAPDTVDRFVSDTKQFTTFDFGISWRQTEWFSDELKFVRGSFECYSSELQNCTQEALRQGILRKRYMQGMQFYLYHYPERLIELIKMKRLSKATVLEFIDALNKQPAILMNLHLSRDYPKQVRKLIESVY